MRTAGIILGSAVLAIAPLAGQEDPLPRGGPFFVNSPTDGVQNLPDVAADAADNYQVVWQTNEAGEVDVLIRRIEADGSHPGQQPLAESTDGDQRQPRVAMEADGDWAAIWTSDHAEEDEQRPTGRLTSEGGTVLENEFDFTIGDEPDVLSPDIAFVGEDNLVGAWQEQGFEGDIVANLRTRKDVDLGLAPVAAAVNSSLPALAGLGDDDWVLAWHAPDASSNGAYLRCHVGDDAAEVEFLAHGLTGGDQTRPDVAALGGGRFVAVWQDGARVVGRFFLRREDGGCTPDDPEFEVVADGAAAVAAPRIGVGPDGALVVVWSATSPDPDGIAARELEHDGTPVGSAFTIVPALEEPKSEPAVAVSTSTFLVVWTQASGEPVDLDIAAQGFHRRLIFSDGFELGGAARWSDRQPPI